MAARDALISQKKRTPASRVVAGAATAFLFSLLPLYTLHRGGWLDDSSVPGPFLLLSGVMVYCGLGIAAYMAQRGHLAALLKETGLFIFEGLVVLIPMHQGVLGTSRAWLFLAVPLNVLHVVVVWFWIRFPTRVSWQRPSLAGRRSLTSRIRIGPG